MKTFARLAVLASLFTLPAIASARPVFATHTHTETVHDRGPQAHFRTVEAHR